MLASSGGGRAASLSEIGRRLERPFFERYTPTVARELLGKNLVREHAGSVLSGKIVETEAYRGVRDPASHAYRGITKRNAVMFGESGRAYVYFSYGNHYCLNLTTEKRGVAGAVLIRALEPREGIGLMKMNRGLDSVTQLTNGPGKLTKAMGIDLDLNGEDVVTSPRLYVTESDRSPPEVGSSSRIGITRGVRYRWRFYIRGNPYVSRAKPSRP
jgi:DNA-3-methyladenine glycosylase